ncbi:MAG: hypothetical protein P8Y53_16960 [Pseudolabrys sp.]|jgi:hypothetical protein
MKMRTIAIVLLATAGVAASATPVLAWWQFVALGPHGERKVYTRFRTEKACKTALEAVEKRLEKKYPNTSRFPLVGSCEEYH